METKTVDDFVKRKVAPQFHPVVEMLRQLMREAAPKAKEMMNYGLPMWIGKDTLAWISPTKKDITFGFMRGVEFEDKYGLLKGVGKLARHVKVKDLESANKAALRYYIKQALKHDTN